MENKVALFVPNAEAAKFLLFQRFYEPISVLIDSGVFEQKNATVELNFDSNGTLMVVKRFDIMYSKKHQGYPQS